MNPLVDAQHNDSSATTREIEARGEVASSPQSQDTKRTPEGDSGLDDLTPRMSELLTSENPVEPSAASEQDSAALIVAGGTATVKHVSSPEMDKKDAISPIVETPVSSTRPGLQVADSISEATRIDAAGSLDYAYRQVFPESHSLVETSTHKFQCGVEALRKSLQHFLLFHVEEPQLQRHLQAAGVQGINNSAGEELAKLLFYLGWLEGKTLSLGIYCEGEPQKLIYRTEDAERPEYQVVWISNDMKGFVSGRMGH